MKAWLNGIGWQTPAGPGPQGAAIVQPLIGGPLEIPTRKQIFAAADKRFGRLDDFSRVGLAAAAFCLRDAGAEDYQETRPIGIVAASRYGCLATDIAYLETMLVDGGKLASPNLFAYTLANSFLGEVALRFGLGGNSLVINQQDNSRLAAIHFALEELATSTQSGMLAGICDLPGPDPADQADLPGAVFLLLAKEPGASRCYGCLENTASGLSLAGERVSSLAQLLERCLIQQS
ncbi:beta-ketoacyl synthase N-terminal-like domain-containing protein [Pelobacter seleniigenes]|uniref:beta-ketoacyl synthase N-terminal-like domain-containing protein n=1 Tax=Pelobacter seleniigenes TaxID=407188 RepID=UPI0004A6D6CC|nr:beta-ketoacyl synthase N-terminal-like domain-containing protein [Pelobacter seleniigenes]